MATNLIPGNAALPFFRSQPAAGQEAAEIGVTGAILRQQNDRRTIIDGDLRAKNQSEPKLPRFNVRANNAINAISIGYSESRQPEPI
jgi:Iap family predicted aminopeptidase